MSFDEINIKDKIDMVFQYIVTRSGYYDNMP